MNFFRKQWRIEEILEGDETIYSPQWTLPWLPIWFYVEANAEAPVMSFETLAEARAWIAELTSPLTEPRYHSPTEPRTR